MNYIDPLVFAVAEYFVFAFCFICVQHILLNKYK